LIEEAEDDDSDASHGSNSCGDCEDKHSDHEKGAHGSPNKKGDNIEARQRRSMRLRKSMSLKEFSKQKQLFTMKKSKAEAVMLPNSSMRVLTALPAQKLGLRC